MEQWSQAVGFYRGFARSGTHLYAHDFAPLPGFFFVWRSIKKQKKKKKLELLIYFIERIKISIEYVC